MNAFSLYLDITRDFLKNFRYLLRPHQLTLKAKRSEGDITVFIFTSKTPIRHIAGQYGSWRLNRWVWGKPIRLFTIASPPGDEEIHLATRISNTDFKQKLAQLEPGQNISMLGPLGNFTVPNPAPEHIVLLAGGIGITPMRAIAKDLFDNNSNTNVTLIHSADDTYLYREEMEQYCSETHFTNRDGFGKTCDNVVATKGKDVPYFVSGPPGFVAAAEKELQKRGVTTIKKDGFLGY